MVGRSTAQVRLVATTEGVGAAFWLVAQPDRERRGGQCCRFRLDFEDEGFTEGPSPAPQNIPDHSQRKNGRQSTPISFGPHSVTRTAQAPDTHLAAFSILTGGSPNVMNPLQNSEVS